MQKIDEYRNILKINKSRNTPQKESIFLLFLTESKPLTTNFIIKSSPNIDKSTVYRIIESFVQLNIIKTIPRGFKTLYEIGDKFHPHHHHITCEICGKTTAITSHKLEDLINEISQESDMTPSHHHIELYGFCKTCKK